MADDLEAALAVIENPSDMGNKTWLLTVYASAARALADAIAALLDELERLRAQNRELTMQLDGETRERVRLSGQVDVMHANHAHTKKLLDQSEAELREAREVLAQAAAALRR